MVVDLIFAAVLLYCIVLTVVVLLGGRPLRRLRRDPGAYFTNDGGQRVAQVDPNDLADWLERHKSFELVSISSVGPYVIVVYK